MSATTQRPRPSYVGLVISAGLLALVLFVWNARREATAPPPEPVRRGGQIVASIRSEPRSFNRVLVTDQTSDLIYTLTQGRLVRINRSTFELEPWLAERWESSADGRTHTLHLREGVTWSDGTPFTSADVLFSLRAATDPRVPSVVTSSATVGGEPIRASAPDDRTIVLTYPAPSGLGLRLLDGLPILPRHKLAAALEAGTFAQAWGTTTPPAELAGTGPFLVREYHPGQRLVLERNPRYWRRGPDGEALPYLDRIVLEVVPEQNAELVRLLAGAIDLTSSELRPEDHVPVRRAEQEGKLKRVELGVATDADAFWFCLKPEARRSDPRFAFVARREFRQAISHAVDREEFARTVFLGEAVPIWGPITPANRQWFSPNVPRYPFDLDRARGLLRSIGLEDRNGNGVVEDARGTEARFTVITQRGVGYYERGTSVLRDHVARVGIALDVAPLEQGAMIKRMLDCDYDAIYMRFLATDLDPAGNLDFWLSSGSAHVWNRQQRTPATEWEQRIDTLMLEQAATLDPERRKTIFDTVQRILAENVPILYFAAPRIYAAHSTRLRGVIPSVMRPAILWNADALSVAR
ncbi:MAG TPA: ABC transporter substrate-binding protein [Vicinamibacterales bacterium]|nr:ABC transporter substrate-binding protein [Vicinamibacterales bacterium]